jgi:hypothetical protein
VTAAKNLETKIAEDFSADDRHRVDRSDHKSII